MLYISARDHAGKLKFSRVLYFSFGTYKDVNIKQLCSSRMYEHKLLILSRLNDFMTCS